MASAFLINGSIREEVPIEVIRYLRDKGGYLVADAQTFIRIIAEDHRLIHAPWPEMKDFLALLDVLKADAGEAESLTGEKDLHKAAKKLAALGPKEIVLTNRDGITVFAKEKFYQVPFRPGEIIGRSGRGDTCIASYMSARLNASPQEAIVWSAAVTSLKMQAEGPIVKKRQEVVEFIDRNYGDYK
jgi:sugar/nucleoside kinase (ribokinase family)